MNDCLLNGVSSIKYTEIKSPYIKSKKKVSTPVSYHDTADTLLADQVFTSFILFYLVKNLFSFVR